MATYDDTLLSKVTMISKAGCHALDGLISPGFGCPRRNGPPIRPEKLGENSAASIETFSIQIMYSLCVSVGSRIVWSAAASIEGFILSSVALEIERPMPRTDARRSKRKK